jgi:hypothetical protein
MEKRKFIAIQWWKPTCPALTARCCRENLKLTFEQRARKHARALKMVLELRRAGKTLRT